MVKMDVAKLSAFFLVFFTAFPATGRAILHDRNLIWTQTPRTRHSVSRLVGIKGDPRKWVPARSTSIKYITAPNNEWDFKALGFFYREQLLVWSESKHKKIQGLYLNGTTETVDIFTGTSAEVHGLEVDWISGNVYWTDSLYNWVLMAPLQPYSSRRAYRIVAQEGLDNPHGLAVYPQNNLLLISDWGVRPRIERMDLLGGNRDIFVDSDILEPRGMVIDMETLRLYWVDSGKDTIESVSLLPGTLDRKVHQTYRRTTLFDLAIFHSYLFVTERAGEMLKVINRDTDDLIVSFTLNNVPNNIIMYDEAQQPQKQVKCPTFGCEQMCVEDAVQGPQCVCGEGYDLKDDAKGCTLQKQLITPSHLYAVRIAICVYPANIGDMSLINVTWASQCFLVDHFDYLALTFDADNNLLFYSGNYTKNIYAIPLETGAKSTIIASGTGTVQGLALDWVLGMLYWTDSTYAHIKVAQKDGRFQRVLLEDDINNPLGIAVHPKRGKIYWTDIGFQPDILPKIESANMDGSGREVIMKDNLGQPNHIFIDYNTEKLYWSDSILFHVREYDLTSKSVKVFFHKDNARIYGLSLYKDYLLWTDYKDMNGIHVVRLDTMRTIRSILHSNYSKAADLITFDKHLQPNFTSACRPNGVNPCSQMCSPRGEDDYTCSCGLGFQLLDSGRCDVANFTLDNFLVVSDAFQRNIYHLDARSGAIAALSRGEKHKPIAVELDPLPRTPVIYWSDNFAHVIRRRSVGKPPQESDGGQNSSASAAMASAALEFLRLPEDSTVDGLALDAENRLLFFTDTGRDVICVASLDARPVRQATIIREGQDQPRDIVAWPSEAMIFWSDWGKNATINQAKMNGEEREVILHFNRSAWPNGLALDIKGRALYWTDAQNNEIGIFHLDTKEYQIMLKKEDSHFFGLFIMGDFLYVTDWKRRFVSKMHKQGGELMRFGEDKFTKLYGITGYNSTEMRPKGIGVCQGVNQTRCSNTSICVPHTSVGFVCVCIDGYEKIGGICQKIETNTSESSSMPTTTTATYTAVASSPTTQQPPEDVTTSEDNTTPFSAGSRTASFRPTPSSSFSPQTLSTAVPNTSTSTAAATTQSDDDVTFETGDGFSRVTTLSPSASSSLSTSFSHRGSIGAEDSSEDRTQTIIIIAAVVGVLAIAALALAGFLYYRRRRSYQVPHTRLNEDRTHLSSSSGTKVTYACQNGTDNVRFDEGFENPTYGVTVAMLSGTSSESNQ